jgi:hydroxymethylpyrimidine/phosphomethylpyrimidine kinase
MDKKIILTIAGSDSGGGAGIQADLKTMEAFGCYGVSVITAITAQNLSGVSGVHPVPEAMITRQLEAVFSGFDIQAVKIGMLATVPIIQTIHRFFDTLDKKTPIVLDPVMVATSGSRLLADEAVEALIQFALAHATLITPNTDEGSVLTRHTVRNAEEYETLVDAFIKKFPKLNVYLKGGHASRYTGTCINYLITQGSIQKIVHEMQGSGEFHGTGCTLSSAIASLIGLGYELPQAVSGATRYVGLAIQSSPANIYSDKIRVLNHAIRAAEMNQLINSLKSIASS